MKTWKTWKNKLTIPKPKQKQLVIKILGQLKEDMPTARHREEVDDVMAHLELLFDLQKTSWKTQEVRS